MEWDKVSTSPLQALTKKTLYGEIKGTLGFMAPEQVTPGSPINHLTDGYALGCLLYYLIVGKAPYHGDPQEILLRTKKGEYTPLSSHTPRVRINKTLTRIIEKALQPGTCRALSIRKRAQK